MFLKLLFLSCTMVILCQMPELGLSCFGCCGNKYANKRKLMRDINKNTLEFDNKKSTGDFMSRTTHLRSSGICANLIFKNDIFYCPGHPAINSGRDYRNLDPDCDKDFLCKTFGLFQQWDEAKKQRFLAYIKEKKPDSFTYSIKMDNGTFLKEFEEREKEKPQKNL